MTKCVLIAASLLLMAGCEPGLLRSEPTTVWHKEGATQEDFANDKYACMRESTFDELLLEPSFDPYLFVACLNARGWREVPVK